MFVGCVARTVLISALLCCVVLCFRNPFHNREVYMNKLDVKPQPPRHILFSAVLLGSKDDAANDKQSQESPSRGSMQIFSTLEISDPIERQFGLKSEQLRELEEQPLPLPHEVSSNEKSTDGKLFSLPELSEFVRDNKKGKLEKGKARRTKGGISNEQAVQKVNRKNQEEYTKVLQLSPFADADKDIFVEEVGMTITFCATIFHNVFQFITIFTVRHIPICLRHGHAAQHPRPIPAVRPSDAALRECTGCLGVRARQSSH